MYHTGFLSENCLSVDRSHSEECDDPHPEDSAGTTDEDRAARTDDVTRTDLSRNSGCQCLERGNTALLLTAAKREVTKYLLHTLTEATYLNELGSYGIEKTYTDKEY